LASPAGALIEVLVRLELDPEQLPSSYTLLKVEAPESISLERVEVSSLAGDWREDLVLTRNTGDEWLKAGVSALFEVPSAILPETVNFLLNPLHQDARDVSVLQREAYPYDRRLFKQR
jgi:RES domain-containing protein